jgi:3-keto-L-gulonate-6-phosphate decarboxylase
VQGLGTQAVNTLKQLNVEAPDVADIKIRDVKYVLGRVAMDARAQNMKQA